MTTSDKLSSEQKLSQLMDGEWHALDRAQCVASLCADESLRNKWARYHMIRDVMKNEPVQSDLALVSRICSAIDQEPAYTNITPFNAARSGSVVTDDSPSAVDEVNVPVSALDSVDAAQAETSTVSVSELQADGKRTEAVRKSSWKKTGVAGFALAASVALVTLVGVNVFEQQPAPDASVVANNTQSTTVAAPVTSVAQVLLSNEANPGTSVAEATQTSQTGAVQSNNAVLPVVDFVANTTGSHWVSPESSMAVSDEERLNMMLSGHIENSPTAGRKGLLPYSSLVGYRAMEQER